jgi:hypothetical protein
MRFLILRKSLTASSRSISLLPSLPINVAKPLLTYAAFSPLAAVLLLTCLPASYKALPRLVLLIF